MNIKFINVYIDPSGIPGPSGSTVRFRKNSHVGKLTLFLRITRFLFLRKFLVAAVSYVGIDVLQ
jgi:hypothetical protein